MDSRNLNLNLKIFNCFSTVTVTSGVHKVRVWFMFCDYNGSVWLSSFRYFLDPSFSSVLYKMRFLVRFVWFGFSLITTCVWV